MQKHLLKKGRRMQKKRKVIEKPNKKSEQQHVSVRDKREQLVVQALGLLVSVS